MQPTLPYAEPLPVSGQPCRGQLLKWIGNKQRFASAIVQSFPNDFSRYVEPFLGSGAVLATIAPRLGIGGDVFRPLIEIWTTLKSRPEELLEWYCDRWELMRSVGKEAAYEQVRQQFNASPNGADLLFLSRSCYGGVVRFRKADGAMSTPCGPHQPISPQSFEKRVREWSGRVQHVQFQHADFEDLMSSLRQGDFAYCDPPYVDTQPILYGAQGFSFARLMQVIERCKRRGVRVALSIDGTKRSGTKICNVPVPDGLFESEVLIDCGRSMLRRFQMQGQTLEKEIVADRLLLTYSL